MVAAFALYRAGFDAKVMAAMGGVGPAASHAFAQVRAAVASLSFTSVSTGARTAFASVIPQGDLAQRLLQRAGSNVVVLHRFCSIGGDGKQRCAGGAKRQCNGHGQVRGLQECRTHGERAPR